MSLRGQYFDGQSARAQEVELLERHGQVWVRGDDFERCEALDSVRIGEKLGSAARRVEFADHCHVQVSDHDGFAQWLRAIGYRERQVDLMQRSWSLAIASLAIVLVVGVAAYRWGLPVASRYAADRVPESVNQELTRGTLALLEKHLLKPSQLTPERQRALADGFAQINEQGLGRLHFRSAARVGPNAMALPDGTIILLDELVAVATNDEEILAVLAHELAHVEKRHGLRLMIEGAAVAAFFAWWIGDFSPLIAGAPVALLQARHSRALEAEADAVAAYRLRQIGISPSRLADMLESIERAHGLRRKNETSEEASDRQGRHWLEYLSSHPATDRRLQYLRSAQAGQRPD